MSDELETLAYEARRLAPHAPEYPKLTRRAQVVSFFAAFINIIAFLLMLMGVGLMALGVAELVGVTGSPFYKGDTDLGYTRLSVGLVLTISGLLYAAVSALLGVIGSQALAIKDIAQHLHHIRHKE